MLWLSPGRSSSVFICKVLRIQVEEQQDFFHEENNLRGVGTNGKLKTIDLSVLFSKSKWEQMQTRHAHELQTVHLFSKGKWEQIQTRHAHELQTVHLFSKSKWEQIQTNQAAKSRKMRQIENKNETNRKISATGNRQQCDSSAMLPHPKPASFARPPFCILRQNRLHFAAKRVAFCGKMDSILRQNGKDNALFMG